MPAARRPARRARALLAAAALLVAPALVACGGDGGTEAEPTPVATPSGSPFGFEITGPETAEPGQVVTATLTNTGRLPDRFRLEPDPAGSATIAEPEVSVGAGESVEVEMTVTQVPLLVRVKSIASAGQPEGPYLSIGATQ